MSDANDLRRPTARRLGNRDLTRRGLLAGGPPAQPPSYGLTAAGAAARSCARALRSGARAGTVTFGVERVERGAKTALPRTYQAVHQEVTGSTSRSTPSTTTPFQEQINSYLQGQPGRRLHLVRRLPDAVLRRPRASRRRSTTSGRRSTPQMPPAMQGRLDGRSTGTSTSCRSTTTRGPSSTGRASGSRRATRSRRRGTSSSRSPRR